MRYCRRSRMVVCFVLCVCFASSAIAQRGNEEPEAETREWTMMVYVGADSDFYDNSKHEISSFTLKQLRKGLIDPYGADKWHGAVDLEFADMHLCDVCQRR